MIDTEKVRELLNEALQETGAFLVDLRIGQDGKIRILADHMEGMTLEKLSKISRHVENGLDREVTDFEIEVSSPGLDQPFMVKEQYIKNVGRPLKIRLKNGITYNGDFTRFEKDTITLQWEEKQAKASGKGKVKVTREEQFPLSDIEETKVEIRF